MKHYPHTRLIALAVLLFFGCDAMAQTDTTKVLPTDTLILKPTAADFNRIVGLINQAVNLSYTATKPSDKASIPVFLLQALEEIEKVKLERQVKNKK